MIRRLCLRLHRWTGLLAGLYVVVIGITGAAVVFRQDMQAIKYPDFFRLKPEATSPQDGFGLQPSEGGFRLQPEGTADLSILMRELQAAYPGYRLSGIDWPT